ncbi:MAG: response regulator [Synergistaceae bacterium]|nr:response regulator [Synergistaceae bacterium]
MPSLWITFTKSLVRQQALWKEIQRDDLQSALENARDKNRHKSGFIAKLSHEIRTPLNSILGVVNFLQGTKLDLEQKKFVEILGFSSRELLVLVEELLDLSLLEAGVLPIRPTPLDLRSCCCQAVNPLALAVLQRNLNLELTVDSSLPEFLIGDSVRLRQVLQNLVNSAIAFTPKGRISLSVAPAAETRKKVTLLFTLSMEEGMPEVLLKEALEYSDLDRRSFSDPSERAGMGFLIAREIIDAMKGELRIGTGPSGESTISFTLPMTKTPSAGASDSIRSPSSEEKKDELKSLPLSILVVDDNQFNGRLTRTILRKKGGPLWTVALADTGPEALSMMEEHFYDVVFLDIRMPGMDGLQIAEEIRNREKNGTGRSLVFAMTACTMEGDREMCLKAGMDDYLAKPADFEAMKGSILRHLRPFSG